MRVFVNGHALTVKPSQAIGKGGEADVYDIGGGRALKLFKPPHHADFAGCPDQQKAATNRLAEHQRKLRDFPRHLPARVVVPLELACDSPQGKIVGYTMRLITGAEVLLRCGEPSFRQNGVTAADMVALFRDLHSTVVQLHATQTVIGDFNDLNVLVTSGAAYLIDADSFQFGPYLCAVYTDRFVDPLLCAPNEDSPLLCRPHTTDSDWYAFNVMLFHSLLLTGPYGGVYRPKDPAQRVAQAARPLKRITVLDPEVVYPKPAKRPEILSDELLQHFIGVFRKDARGPFPLKILDGLQWSVCANCGCEHARQSCPLCRTVVPAPIPQFVRVLGAVTATEVFRTPGVILRAATAGGNLRWLVYDEGQFVREDRSVVFAGRLERDMCFELGHRSTWVARGGRLIKFEAGNQPEIVAVEACHGESQFACEQDTPHWISDGRLVFRSDLGTENVGEILRHQTRFWLGPAFGFGYYRAAEYAAAFVFRPRTRGINDAVKAPPLPGRWLRARCLFAADRCWFIVQREAAGRLCVNLLVVTRDGAVEAASEYGQDERHWLLGLFGACAVGHALFVPTDEGIVRLETARGQVVETRAFPDTEPFVDAAALLLPANGGLHVVRPKTITYIQIA